MTKTKLLKRQKEMPILTIKILLYNKIAEVAPENFFTLNYDYLQAGGNYFLSKTYYNFLKARKPETIKKLAEEFINYCQAKSN